MAIVQKPASGTLAEGFQGAAMSAGANDSRREFLKRAAVATAAAFPAIIPSRVLGAPGRPGANGRIQVGVIGVGFRAAKAGSCRRSESGQRGPAWRNAAWLKLRKNGFTAAAAIRRSPTDLSPGMRYS